MSEPIENTEEQKEEVTEEKNTILDEISETNIDDLYLCVGNGKYNAPSIINMITKENKTKEEIVLEKVGNTEVKEDAKNDIIVAGVDEIKVNLANCCKPVKGDEVIGYITKGNGIVVHRSNCHNIIDIDERIIAIEWNFNSTNKYKTSILVKLEKKDNNLVNLISKASSYNITILSINLINNSNYQSYNLLVSVSDSEKLNNFINNLYQSKDVISVERLIQ